MPIARVREDLTSNAKTFEPPGPRGIRMKKSDFDKLVVSIRQAGRIRCGQRSQVAGGSSPRWMWLPSDGDWASHSRSSRMIGVRGGDVAELGAGPPSAIGWPRPGVAEGGGGKTGGGIGGIVAEVESLGSAYERQNKPTDSITPGEVLLMNFSSRSRPQPKSVAETSACRSPESVRSSTAKRPLPWTWR